MSVLGAGSGSLCGFLSLGKRGMPNQSVFTPAESIDVSPVLVDQWMRKILSIFSSRDHFDVVIRGVAIARNKAKCRGCAVADAGVFLIARIARVEIVVLSVDFPDIGDGSPDGQKQNAARAGVALCLIAQGEKESVRVISPP